MATFTVTHAQAAAERLAAEHQGIFESLMKLEDHIGNRLLKDAGPEEPAGELSAEVRYGLATLWTLYQTYRTVVLRVHAIRERRSQPTRADLEEIKELVTGTATIALPSPDGSSKPLGRQLTLDELVAEFRTTYAALCDVVSAEKLRRHDQARLNLIDATFADVLRLRRQAFEERHRAHVKIHGVPAPDPALPDRDLPSARLATARQWAQRGDRRRLAAELTALERDADTALHQARAELADAGRPLRERDELRGRLSAYRAKAAAQGRVEDLTLEQRYRWARDLLWSAPCDLAIAAAAVAEYQKAVNATRADGGQG